MVILRNYETNPFICKEEFVFQPCFTFVQVFVSDAPYFNGNQLNNSSDKDCRGFIQNYEVWIEFKTGFVWLF